MKFRFVEVARKSLLRNDEFTARQDFDVGQIFDALPHKFNPVGKGEFAFVLLDDENIQSRNFRGGVFDKVTMPQREGIAVHDDCADWNFLRPNRLFVSLQFLVDESFCVTLFVLRRDTVAMVHGRGERIVKFYVAKEIIRR